MFTGWVVGSCTPPDSCRPPDLLGLETGTPGAPLGRVQACGQRLASTGRGTVFTGVHFSLVFHQALGRKLALCPSTLTLRGENREQSG